ncbi:MAG: ABC transporter permease [Erysipelotrichaceae bacterium]|jgi:putative ABC transport system permease protein|nr:ABC transporter permease [Erysipelotrichaceae bacterium]
MLFIFQTALELGCVYSLVALALFLSYRILDIADLTTDGCFILGMAVSVSSAAAGHPILGIFLGMIAGGCAGYVTAFLQTRMGVPSILAGIITNTGLYTVNLAAMGWSSNVSLLKGDTIYTLFKGLGIGGTWYKAVLAGIICAVCMGLMKWFLSTRIGLSIRATGDNKDMVSASSIDPRHTIMLGLVIANCLTGLSGALAGQMQKSADINGGTGIVVIGLACLIIGETLINGRKNMGRNILACLIGNIVYRLIYAIILRTSIIPIECLKLVTAIIVALAIAAPTIKENMQYALKARREGKN